MFKSRHRKLPAKSFVFTLHPKILRPKQNSRKFADAIVNLIFLNENRCTLFQMSLNFPMDLIDDKSSLSWRPTRDKAIIWNNDGLVYWHIYGVGHEANKSTLWCRIKEQHISFRLKILIYYLYTDIKYHSMRLFSLAHEGQPDARTHPGRVVWIGMICPRLRSRGHLLKIRNPYPLECRSFTYIYRTHTEPAMYL